MAVEHKHITISKRLVMINSASAVVAKVVNFLVLMWVYQYLLKRLSAEEFAVLPVVTSLMVFAPLFFSFFSGGISRYTIDAYAKGDFVGVRQIVSSLLPMLFLAAGIFVPAGVLFAQNIEHVLNIAPQMVGDARIMLILLVVSFAFQMLIIPYRTAYEIRQRYFELKMLQVVHDLLRAGLVVIFLMTFDAGVVWVVVATFIAEIALTSSILFRSFRLVPELRFEAKLFELSKAWELTSFGMWTTLGRLGSIMYTNAATLVLNLYGTAVDVTSYHIGSTFYRQIHGTMNLATQPLQPAITAMNALNDHSRLAATVLRGGRYALWISMSVVVPLILYADVFIDLYLGADYSTTSVIIVLFMIMFPFTQPTILLSNTAIATGHVRVFFLPAFLVQFAGLVLMVFATMWYDLGAIGVTLALTIITVVSQLLYFWGLCLRLIRASFARFRNEVLVPGFLPSLAGAAVWGALRLFNRPDSWIQFALFIGAGLLSYGAVLLVFALNGRERDQLKTTLAGLPRRKR
ncbi:lipopolysaccharide biosynthesis protein [Aliiroseovarius subalbicans]|uniref:lipopolysaccharide biosynthesis protein n=1 Tax=Aliiroseovarius subalbicans TaxID=2925840 RepID=UPI001F5929B1|nr:lipopolysaccharide biosynthesis protein [Aliiroseovarius subalbicans]MCI2401179.1 lipopolysaccharide biosynthesis protein [Aliiroseovarius subalbicans]